MSRTARFCRTFTMCAVIFCAVLQVGMLAAGCVGSKARDSVTGPAVQQLTERTLSDAGSDPVVVEFKAHVAAGEWSAALTLWPQVKAAEEDGIESRVAAGALGVHAAESLTERLKQYDADIHKLGGQ